MSFLSPFFLLFGLLAGPIILLYMLRLRRREVQVSSTLLWEKLLRDREANAPWQKLRRNWLLILQLLILGLLAIALARPFLPVPRVVSGNVVVLLDGSASMAATDVEPSRFAAAQAEVANLVDELSGGDQMTIILAGRTPSVLAAATSDQNLLKASLDGVGVDSAESNWQAAFALASGAAQGYSEAKIVIVSDGGLPDDLPLLPVEAVYVPIGNASENLALNALATREGADQTIELFANVTNSSLSDQTALLNISIGNALYDSRRIEIPANSNANYTWALPQDVILSADENRVIEARLSEQSADFLPIDDIAWAVHEGGVTNRALLITEGNLFLEQLYTALPGIELFKAEPDDEIVSDFDLYIYDRVAPSDTPPAGDMLLIAPPTSSPIVDVTGIYSNTQVTRLADSPLLQYVEWGGVDVLQARTVDAPWATPLISASGGDLLLIGERNGHRVAIFTFSLLESDLPLQIAFPILMANITNWLNPGRAFDAPAGVRVGDAVTIAPSASTTVVTVDPPSNQPWRVDVGDEPLVFADTTELGIYSVRLRENNTERDAGQFAVNLFASAESNITPAENIQVGFNSVANSAENDIGQREFWPWLAALAVLVLILEWWVYHRGLVWPDLRSILQRQ